MPTITLTPRWRLLTGLLAAFVLLQVPLALAAPTTPVVLARGAVAVGSVVLLFMLARRMHDQEEQSEVLLDLSQEMAAQSEVGELLDHMVSAIADMIPAAEKCVIHFLAPDGRRLFPRYASRSDENQMVGMPADSGIAGRALQHRATLLVDDVRRERDFLPLRSNEALRALLVAPLYIGEERLGTLSINSSKPGAFGNRDTRLITLLANQVSVALYQHRLLNISRQERHHTELILNSLSDALLVLDHKGRVVRHNPALATVLGPDLENILGQRVHLHSDDPRLQRLAYLMGDWATEQSIRRRVTLDEPVHAVLDIDVTPVKDEAGRWVRIVAMHDLTATADALATQTRLLQAAAHGLQAPLKALGSGSGTAGHMARQMERLRLDLLAVAEPIDALALGRTTHQPLSAVLEGLQSELSPEAARALDVHVHPVLARQQVPGEGAGVEARARLDHLLATLVEETCQRADGAPVTLDIEGQPEEIVFTVRGPGTPRRVPAPGEELGFGIDQMTLSLYVAQRMAEALGGHLWTLSDGPATRHQLILPTRAASSRR